MSFNSWFISLSWTLYHDLCSIVNCGSGFNGCSLVRNDNEFFDYFSQTISCFVICSSMHNTIDATQIGQGPVVNNNPHMFIYYFVFVVIFTFMIINIYIALIILTFQRQGEKEIEGGLDRNQVSFL